MSDDILSRIRSSAKRALSGQTLEPLLQYSFSYSFLGRKLLIRAEVERELSEDEHEKLEVAVTEIYSDFWPDFDITMIVDIVTEAALKALPDGIVYRRDVDGR